MPLPEQLSSLAEQHRAADDQEVSFAVTGTPRLLGVEAALTAYRTAQEALTNARKHAPGQAIRMFLDYTESEVTVLVVNRRPAVAGAGDLAATGAGYGLTGLRERAALAGGTLEAGPDDGDWRVYLRIPA
jgi:signal transduction histidine kinase